MLVEKKIIFEGAKPGKGLRIWPFKKNKVKIYVFENFTKKSSEMNITHPFYLFDTDHFICKRKYTLCGFYGGYIGI